MPAGGNAFIETIRPDGTAKKIRDERSSDFNWRPENFSEIYISICFYEKEIVHVPYLVDASVVVRYKPCVLSEKASSPDQVERTSLAILNVRSRQKGSRNRRITVGSDAPNGIIRRRERDNEISTGGGMEDHPLNGGAGLKTTR
ncbi:hypothetical protein L1987_53273 [Smallanthus sonchifolius]|uniref:Uncharacterized protein n=1 Tax=Smallanthus sonchifolius TaxID=185202 RepID=A0ACB9EVW8_9ASTR|nr:hypothetical protein L1987_53273 [Smallanthus sonchifolius]